MKCHFCNKVGTDVIDSRPYDDYKKIKRRRECAHCQKKFTTHKSASDSTIHKRRVNKKLKTPSEDIYTQIKRRYG